MERWKGRVAIVTGANSGIGLSITKKLLQCDLKVIALDRNVTELEKIKENHVQGSGNLHSVKTNICIDEDVIKTFQWIETEFGGADILINNAAINGKGGLLNGSPAQWREMLDVNVVALCVCTKEAISSMQRRNVHDGHIVNMSSFVTQAIPTFEHIHFYSGTKHAVQALSECFRQELSSMGSTIKITTICPGLVKTGIFKSSLGETMEKLIFSTEPYLEPEDVASAIEYIIGTPAHVQVHNFVIKPPPKIETNGN